MSSTNTFLHGLILLSNNHVFVIPEDLSIRADSSLLVGPVSFVATKERDTRVNLLLPDLMASLAIVDMIRPMGMWGTHEPGVFLSGSIG
jgi:hypothetical protein